MKVAHRFIGQVLGRLTMRSVAYREIWKVERFSVTLLYQYNFRMTVSCSNPLNALFRLTEGPSARSNMPGELLVFPSRLWINLFRVRQALQCGSSLLTWTLDPLHSSNMDLKTSVDA